ncbi:MAG: hypothetical protein U1F25_04050 [Rubrivivax sp.]
MKLWPSGPLTLGLAARHTDGTYPYSPLAGGITGADDFKRNDVDLLATWVATGASTLTARLSQTKRTTMRSPSATCRPPRARSPGSTT